MNCQHCLRFLDDYLAQTISNELSLSKELRMKSIQKILPEFTDWMYKLCFRLSAETFDKAYKTACQIARRDRKQIEYEFILFTATSNFLSFEVPWFSKELDYMKVLLVEAGLVKTKRRASYLTVAREYLTYMIPRTIFMLRHLHADHLNPKGLLTDLSTTIGIVKYQERNKEVDLDDLYT